jgi:sortase A
LVRLQGPLWENGKHRRVSILQPVFFGPISRGKINAAVQPEPIYVPQAQGAAGTTSIAVANNGDGSPVRLIIPKINVDAGFQYTGLTPDGVMEIPNNVVDIGWFTGSPRPGERGSAVVTGHVAQIRGGILTKPGVFYNLNGLSAGDKLYVINDKGESVTFIVRESRIYDPSADATDVFTSTDGGVHLNLITCDGFWNQDQLSYSQRLVIFTDAE